jgi:hypothetical protein
VGVTVDDGTDDSIPSRRIMAMDADGSNPRMLFENKTALLRRAISLDRVVGRVPGTPSQVLMPAWTGHNYNLFRVDVNSGAATQIARGHTGTFAWRADDGLPALRYDKSETGTTVRVYGHSGAGDDDWSLIARYGRVHSDVLDWDYAGDAPGVGQIYVRTRKDDADTAGIYPFDIRTKVLGPAVSDVRDYDLHRVFYVDDRFGGVTYFGDTLTYVLTDRTLQKHLEGVQRYFKGEANVFVRGIDRAANRLLLEVVGPRAPGDYYLYDVGRAKLDFITSEREWLEPERLAGVEVRKVRMRDGATITSYLTRPNDAPAGPLPLVVMPHGGPESRDRVDFDAMAQAFAAQGWLVMQPNFRGSSGYGRKFAEAGHRQWAKRMQDDVTDAVNDLVQHGIADRQRIVIYGSSYGGLRRADGRGAHARPVPRGGIARRGERSRRVPEIHAPQGWRRLRAVRALGQAHRRSGDRCGRDQRRIATAAREGDPHPDPAHAWHRGRSRAHRPGADHEGGARRGRQERPSAHLRR